MQGTYLHDQGHGSQQVKSNLWKQHSWELLCLHSFTYTAPWFYSVKGIVLSLAEQVLQSVAEA